MNNKTESAKEELWQVVETWIKKQKVSCPEAIYQCDWMQEALTDLAEEVCEIVGYTDE